MPIKSSHDINSSATLLSSTGQQGNGDDGYQSILSSPAAHVWAGTSLSWNCEVKCRNCPVWVVRPIHVFQQGT